MKKETDGDPLATREMPATKPQGPEKIAVLDQGSGSGSGRLEVRCPTCHVQMEVAVDTQLTDLTCSSCGSHFSLVDQGKATRMAPSLSKMGRFDLIERLGVGSFGSVWKARDKQLDRTVAVKIPRAGGMTAEEQEKFFREARAAAQLRHPNIVSVHEVGRDGDSVYIVSDFVRGVTLGDWLTGRRLTNREAAEFCAKVADALHHAHEQGVVHRDLKPANIIIDGDGEPHLMDFGLARRESGETTVTMDGEILGTPAYMSPEQAQGEAHTADRRSDVYSLGVILFQLLTGELPFRGNARMLIHQVINDEPPSPRKLDANVSKDMETIALKCLQKDPARRYATAADVATDLRRYLAGEPITARPVGALERRWRWCQRNPAVASLTAAAVGLLAAVAIVASVGYATTSRALREKEQAAATAEQVSKFLSDLFRSSDPIGWASGDNFEFVAQSATSANLTVRELIDRGANRIETELAGQPDVQATLLETIGGVYREMGMFSEAAAILENALHKREGIVPANQLKIATAKHNLGNALYMSGQYQEGERYLRSALAARRQLLGNEHLDTSSTLQSLGLVLGTVGKSEEGDHLLDEAIAIRRRLLGDDSQGVAIALATKAAVLLTKGDVEAANPSITEALLVFSKKKGESYAPETIMKYQQAMLAIRDERFADAESLMKETLDAGTKLLGPGHPYVGFIAAEYAVAQAGLQDYQGACETDERVMAICRKTLPAKHPMVVLLGRRLTSLYVKLKRFDDALAMSNQVVADSISLHGDKSIQHAGCLIDRANLFCDWGKSDEAVKTAREAYAIATVVPGRNGSNTWEFRRTLAKCLLADKQPDEVFPLLTDTTPVSEGQRSDPDLDRVHKLESLELLGQALLATGKSDDAERTFQGGQQLAESGPKPRPAWAARFQTLHARLLAEKGGRDDAAGMLQHASETLERLKGREHPWTKAAAEALEALRASGSKNPQAAKNST